MKRLLTLPSILGFILALSPASSIAAVTWAAQGLPPGLSINASTGAITGKPTQAGNYTVIVYPKLGNAAGYMNSIKITVLPAGVNIPTYYVYNRLTSGGDRLNGNSIAGGGGYIWGINETLNIPEVTSNGITFSEPSLPPNITQLGANRNQEALAVCGTKTLYLGGDSNNLVHCLLSTRVGSFYEVPLPSTTYPPYNSYAVLSSDGVGCFYLVSFNSQNPSWDVWKSPSSSIAWTQIGSISFNNLGQAPNTISVTKNSNTVVLAFQGGDGGAGFLTSTNGGATFFNDTSNPQITSVAYGNGKFLGTGSAGTGVWSSSDGQNWTQISAVDPGSIIYSSYEKSFFSTGSVSNNGASDSADGIYWIPYQGSLGIGFPVGGAIGSSGTGLVFLQGSQLSTNYIPNGAYGNFQTSVGKTTTITATH